MKLRKKVKISQIYYFIISEPDTGNINIQMSRMTF